jgi:hypothetical protein
MKYIKKLNIDFDNWNELNNYEFIDLFINDKDDKYALYLNKYQYYNIFLPYIKKNNIELYWINNKNVLNFNIGVSYYNIVLYKLKENNYLLTCSNLNYFNKKYIKKMELL